MNRNWKKKQGDNDDDGDGGDGGNIHLNPTPVLTPRDGISPFG